MNYSVTSTAVNPGHFCRYPETQRSEQQKPGETTGSQTQATYVRIIVLSCYLYITVVLDK